MLSTIQSYGLSGVDGFHVRVEVDISNGLPAYETVGLPDAVVRESKERIRSAVKNSGLIYPVSRVTVNLAPADTRKEGSFYDLPIAIGLLCACGQLPADAAGDMLILGELGLDGTVREINGVLPMLIDAYSHGSGRVMLPAGNAAEASHVKGMEVYAVETLADAVRFLKGESKLTACPAKEWNDSEVEYSSDFADIRGQQGAKRAAEVAAAGGHNMLLIGVPGSGKTMLARSIPSILPELSFEEALEITKIHSIVGAVPHGKGIVTERPFRAPHHNASAAALIGGGAKAMPGEISLAQFGVLFMDEFPEFAKEVLESLRQPLEDGVVTITRAAAKSTYPARFMLVAAMNPCPCGNYGSRLNPCRCTPSQISKYLGKISNPLIDRIDLHVEMSEVSYTDIAKAPKAESSAKIRERVNAARRRQLERYRGQGVFFNAQLKNNMVQQYCKPDEEGEKLLKQAFNALNLSARAYHRVLKVSRTIADLAGSEAIRAEDIAEALQYRSLDRKYWGGEA